MTAYILRDIDPRLWKRVKVRTAQDGVSIRFVILKALVAYVQSPKAPYVIDTAPDPTV